MTEISGKNKRDIHKGVETVGGSQFKAIRGAEIFNRKKRGTKIENQRASRETPTPEVTVGEGDSEI